MTTIEKIKIMCIKIQDMLNSGMTLQQITQKTYKMREAGEDMMYFGWLTKSKDPKEACIVAKPIKAQKEYYELFNEIAEGSKHYPKYVLFIHGDKRFDFRMNDLNTGKIIKTDLLK